MDIIKIKNMFLFRVLFSCSARVKAVLMHRVNTRQKQTDFNVDLSSFVSVASGYLLAIGVGK